MTSAISVWPTILPLQALSPKNSSLSPLVLLGQISELCLLKCHPPVFLRPLSLPRPLPSAPNTVDVSGSNWCCSIDTMILTLDLQRFTSPQIATPKLALQAFSAARVHHRPLDSRQQLLLAPRHSPWCRLVFGSAGGLSATCKGRLSRYKAVSMFTAIL